MFEPEFNGPIEGWTVNYLKKNFWRVSRFYEYEDCHQLSYLVFLEVKEKYKDTVDNPKWFMSLYQRSFMNRFIDLSNVNTKLNKTKTFSDLSAHSKNDYIFEVPYENELIGDLDNDGIMQVMIDSAPEDVKNVLRILISIPTEMMEILLSSWKNNGKKKPMGNEFICNLLGLDNGKEKIIEKIKDFLV